MNILEINMLQSMTTGLPLGIYHQSSQLYLVIFNLKGKIYICNNFTLIYHIEYH